MRHVPRLALVFEPVTVISSCVNLSGKQSSALHSFVASTFPLFSYVFQSVLSYQAPGFALFLNRIRPARLVSKCRACTLLEFGDTSDAISDWITGVRPGRAACRGPRSVQDTGLFGSIYKTGCAQMKEGLLFVLHVVRGEIVLLK